MSEIDRRDFIRMGVALGALAGVGGTSAAGAAAEGAADDAETLVALNLTEASRRMHTHQITSVQLTQAYLDRIKIYNPKLNAFITVMHDDALAQAKALDLEAKAGRFRGPLHGLPIVLKDNIDTAGTRTTAASQVFDDRIPDEDAFVTTRLKDAGAVILGKANMHEFAIGHTSSGDLLRAGAESMGAGPYPGRFFGRLRSSGDRGSLLRGCGHGHRRLGADAGRILQHGRFEADLWSGVDPRDCAADVLARSLRSDDQKRGRCGAAAEHAGRLRQVRRRQRGAREGRLHPDHEAARRQAAAGDSASALLRQAGAGDSGRGRSGHHGAERSGGEHQRLPSAGNRGLQPALVERRDAGLPRNALPAQSRWLFDRDCAWGSAVGSSRSTM